MLPLPPSTRIETLLAPYHEVPDDRYVAIEHPGIIKNLERGISSLGGDKQISNVRLIFYMYSVYAYVLR